MTAEHVYQLYIRAEIDDVWRALTDPESTRQFFHATHWESPPVVGETFQTHLPDGQVAIDGLVEEVKPPIAWCTRGTRSMTTPCRPNRRAGWRGS